jgi:hypothetical protein
MQVNNYTKIEIYTEIENMENLVAQTQPEV